MDDFTSETFAEAAHVLDTYGADAARAASVLRRPGPLRAQAAVLTASDTSRLRLVLSRQQPSGRVYCVVGGLARQGDTFQLNIVQYMQIMYLLHSDIASMRSHIEALRGGEAREDVSRMILQDRVDAIRFRSRVLAEMMLHLVRVAADPYLPGMLLRRGGLKGPPAGTQAEEDAANALLQMLVRDYFTRIAQAGEDLKSSAFDRARMDMWLREFPANPLPLWISWRDEPDARVLDDVWIPKDLFDPIVRMTSGQNDLALAINQIAAQ